MFGLKLFAKTKTKKLAREKDRKQFFAIQDYYKKKNESSDKIGTRFQSNKKK